MISIKRRGLELTWVLAMSAAACGGGMPEDARGDLPDARDPSGVVRDLGAQAAAAHQNDPALAADLTGRYFVRKRRALIQTVPLVGDTETVATSFGLASIEVQNGVAELSERYCRSTTESSAAIRTVVPDALPRSLEEIRQPLTVWRDGSIVRWRRPEVVVVSGAHLADPRSDALPVQATDSRVFDQDRDGHPGVTVNVEGVLSGSLFLVQRSIDRYEGKVDIDGELSALLEHESLSRIVEATNPLLRNEVPQRADPDASKSNVLMVRVAGRFDCDALIEALPRLLVQ